MARLFDGFSTIILSGGVEFWEIEVTPPNVDGGGPNETTTMRNLFWRTKQPKKLKSLGTITIRAAYNPRFYNTAVGAVNVNVLQTLRFPDGNLLSFWGWLDKFTPDRIREGEQPTAEITFECSNQDNAGNEVAPSVFGGPA